MVFGIVHPFNSISVVSGWWKGDKPLSSEEPFFPCCRITGVEFDPLICSKELELLDHIDMLLACTLLCYIFLFYSFCSLVLFSDHQKLEREARICRLLKHPNIGKFMSISAPFLATGHAKGDCSSRHNLCQNIYFIATFADMSWTVKISRIGQQFLNTSSMLLF